MKTLITHEYRPHYCYWLWHAITILCDGNVTCGLDDAHSIRSFGNVNTSSVKDCFNSEAVNARRLALLRGQLCLECSLFTPVRARDLLALAPNYPYPRHAVVEPTIRCNLRCRNPTCELNNDKSANVRHKPYLRFETFCRVMDELGPFLEDLFFFNYGEPFVHPRAIDMLRYIRTLNSDVRILTNTNGIILSDKHLTEEIVRYHLLDYIGFTIAGSDQESYAKYHLGGKFRKTIQGMQNMVDVKRRLGKTKPVVIWRYLLFSWNDTDKHIAEARRLAAEIGVDMLKFFLTSIPPAARSQRREPGTSGFQLIKDSVEFEYSYLKTMYFLASGLYHPEISPELGKCCWTCACAHVRVPVRNIRASLRLNTCYLPNGKNPPAVTIRTRWERKPGIVGLGVWADNELTVPKNYMDSSIAVDLEIDPTFVPLSCGLNRDPRELGVRVPLEDVLPTPGLL